MASLMVTIFCICVVSGAKLPSSFIKCDQKKSDFSQCLAKAVENAIRQLSKPIPEVGLPIVDPLEIPEASIGAGTGPVAFRQNFKNLKFSGTSKVDCSKAEFDPVAKKFSFDCFFSHVVMSVDYEINGKILMLPIFGKGPGDITLDKLALKQTFDMEEYEKRGNKYFKIVGYKVSIEPGKVHFHLENLFNGDKALSDNVLQVMNDNWEDVFADIKTGYEDAYGRIIASIFNGLLRKVPIKDLW